MATAQPAALLSLTRFVGRDRELGELVRLLPTTRLLTLTGAGGSGKTRLASEAAARSPVVFEQVAWADLAPIHEEARVVSTIGAALANLERSDLHTVDQLVDAITDRTILLVMDNCEHLVDACAGIAESLLRRCPRLTIMATSREALGVPGETAWLVPSMAEDEAVQLFTERAQSVMPAFTLTATNTDAVRGICRRLDGLPLAIELAAARVRVLSPQQIFDRLSDAFSLLSSGNRTALARQRTLRGAIDWSFALLTPQEQQLLLRLSVFAGSFSIDAVETICTGAPLDEASVLDELSGLVDKSLVVMDLSGEDARYRLLETVRQYAHELQNATEFPDRVRERHALYYVGLAERAEPRLFGGATDMSLIAAITSDIDNFRAALDWCESHDALVESALRGGYALHWYWFAQAQFDEGRTRLQVARRHADNTAIPAGVRGRAMIALGHFNLWQGRPVDALACLERSLSLLRDGDDRFSLAYALNSEGAARYLTGDLARATSLLTEAASLASAYPDHVLPVIISYWLGRMQLENGDFDGAQATLEFAAVNGRRIRHRPAMGHPLLMLGQLALMRGQPAAAHAAFVEALDNLEPIGDLWGMAQGLEGVGCALSSANASDTAAVLLANAEAMRERIVAPRLPAESERIAAVVRDLEVALGRRFEDLWSTGRALTRDAAVLTARTTPWPAVASPRAEVETSVTATPAPAAAPSAVGVPAAPAVTTPVTPVADLTVRMLAPIGVCVRGVSVDGGAWGSARARELLLFLVCHQNGVTKEQVGAAFWPEASSAQVRNTFHVTLHRLRKALGHPEWITSQSDRYRLASELVVDCDALQFEREMSEALRLTKRRGERAEEALSHALRWYTQDLLAGESLGDWPIPLHDKLQRLFFDGLNALATLQLEHGRHRDAITTSRRLLAVDSLDEDAWRRIMTAHARADERAQALRAYQQIVDIVARELESEPDRATVKLAQRIQQGEAV